MVTCLFHQMTTSSWKRCVICSLIFLTSDKSLHSGWKYAQMFFHWHCLFWDVNTFARAKHDTNNFYNQKNAICGPHSVIFNKMIKISIVCLTDNKVFAYILKIKYKQVYFVSFISFSFMCWILPDINSRYVHLTSICWMLFLFNINL